MKENVEQIRTHLSLFMSTNNIFIYVSLYMSPVKTMAFTLRACPKRWGFWTFPCPSSQLWLGPWDHVGPDLSDLTGTGIRGGADWEDHAHVRLKKCETYIYISIYTYIYISIHTYIYIYIHIYPYIYVYMGISDNWVYPKMAIVNWEHVDKAEDLGVAIFSQSHTEVS